MDLKPPTGLGTAGKRLWKSISGDVGPGWRLDARDLHLLERGVLLLEKRGLLSKEERGEIISRAEHARRAPPCQAFVSPPEARESMKRRERVHKEEAIALLEALGVEAVSVTESPKRNPVVPTDEDARAECSNSSTADLHDKGGQP